MVRSPASASSSRRPTALLTAAAQAAPLSTDLENLYDVGQVTTAGGFAVGVSKYDAVDNAEFGIHGQPGMIVPVSAGADINAGAAVMSDANGRAIPWVTAASDANHVLGIAMTGVDITAAGDADVEVKLILGA
jgi:hypothetical protein